jgi:hypothetical protein
LRQNKFIRNPNANKRGRAEALTPASMRPIRKRRARRHAGVALHCLQGLLNHASVWLRLPTARAQAVIDAGMRLFAR